MSDQTVQPTPEDATPPHWRAVLAYDLRHHGADAALAITGGASLGAAFTTSSEVLAYVLAALALASGATLAVRNWAGEGR